jgi:hypothetical protein
VDNLAVDVVFSLATAIPLRDYGDKPLAGIGLDLPGGDAQQSRFARAVAPDQADPVAGCNRQSRAGKQWRHTEGEADVL